MAVEIVTQPCRLTIAGKLSTIFNIVVHTCLELFIHVESPSPPMNLSVIATDNGSVILEWNPPRDNGGTDIIHYQIFINSSEVRSNVTMATIVYLILRKITLFK